MVQVSLLQRQVVFKVCSDSFSSANSSRILSKSHCLWKMLPNIAPIRTTHSNIQGPFASQEVVLPWFHSGQRKAGQWNDWQDQVHFPGSSVPSRNLKAFLLLVRCVHVSHVFNKKKLPPPLPFYWVFFFSVSESMGGGVSVFFWQKRFLFCNEKKTPFWGKKILRST